MTARSHSRSRKRRKVRDARRRRSYDRAQSAWRDRVAERRAKATTAGGR